VSTSRFASVPRRRRSIPGSEGAGGCDALGHPTTLRELVSHDDVEGIGTEVGKRLAAIGKKVHMVVN
jgi:hypothetical protein